MKKRIIKIIIILILLIIIIIFRINIPFEKIFPFVLYFLRGILISIVIFLLGIIIYFIFKRNKQLIKGSSQKKLTGPSSPKQPTKNLSPVWKIISLTLIVLIVIISSFWFIKAKEKAIKKPKTELVYVKFAETVSVNLTNQWIHYSLEEVVRRANKIGFLDSDLYFSFNNATKAYCVRNKDMQNAIHAVRNEDVSGDLPYKVLANRHLYFKLDGDNKCEGTLVIKIYSKKFLLLRKK